MEFLCDQITTSNSIRYNINVFEKREEINSTKVGRIRCSSFSLDGNGGAETQSDRGRKVSAIMKTKDIQKMIRVYDATQSAI